MTKFFLALIVLVLVFPATGFSADIYTGSAVDVLSGDTFVLETEHGKIRVRLAEIDSPDPGEPYGPEAVDVLSAALDGRRVRVVVLKHDKNGINWSHVYADDRNVNYQMVRSGAARARSGYVNDYMIYSFEEEARNARIGLWGLY